MTTANVFLAREKVHGSLHATLAMETANAQARVMAVMALDSVILMPNHVSHAAAQDKRMASNVSDVMAPATTSQQSLSRVRDAMAPADLRAIVASARGMVHSP